MTDAEVIVVGGGPAGASVAFALARQGVDVLVLDRARFPRPKPCSEYMSPQASRLLDEMGVLAEVQRAGAAQLAGMIIRAPNGTLIRGVFAGDHRWRGHRDRGLSLQRTLLDPTFYFSPALRMEDAVVRLRRFAADHPRFMFSADSRSIILPWLTRAASVLRLPRPHWRYMGLFQRITRMHLPRQARAHAG